MITDKTVGALVSNSIFQRYANAGGEIDIQALIDAAQAGSPLISNLTQTELWKIIGLLGYSGTENSSITSLVFTPTSSVEGMDLEAGFVGITSFNAPNLISVGSGGYIELDFPNVETILFPALQSCSTFHINGQGTSLVTALDLSLLISHNFGTSACPNLTSILYNPEIFNQSSLNFNLSGCAIPVSIVNAIMADMAAGSITNISITLDGGTNAIPTGQGLIDLKSVLLNRPNSSITLNWINYSGTSDADFLAASGSFGQFHLSTGTYLNPTNSLIQNIFAGLQSDPIGIVSFTATGLVYCQQDIIFTGNSSLTTVSFPNVIINRASTIDFSGCALLAASVNHILARCVASISHLASGCNIDLSGGTNAAPTGQGITDKQTLIDAGNNVTTN